MRLAFSRWALKEAEVASDDGGRQRRAVADIAIMISRCFCVKGSEHLTDYDTLTVLLAWRHHLRTSCASSVTEVSPNQRCSHDRRTEQWHRAVPL
jgi:hypothetical protein